MIIGRFSYSIAYNRLKDFCSINNTHAICEAHLISWVSVPQVGVESQMAMLTLRYINWRPWWISVAVSYCLLCIFLLLHLMRFHLPCLFSSCWKSRFSLSRTSRITTCFSLSSLFLCLSLSCIFFNTISSFYAVFELSFIVKPKARSNLSHKTLYPTIWVVAAIFTRASIDSAKL